MTAPGPARGSAAGRPGAAGRRVARRLHLGRARPAARGADRFEVEAISGTSAGAMNAAVFAHGMAVGGREAARAALEDFWRRVSRAARVQPVPAQPARRAARELDPRQFAGLRGDGSDGAAGLALRARRRGGNPLRDILAAVIDFDRLESGPVKLFITATNVRTGRGRVFRRTRSRPTCCSPRPACRRCSRRSRSTASPTGTAASAATRR